MTYEFAPAVSAGLIGGAVMAAILYLGAAFSPRQMRIDLFYTLGSLLASTNNKPMAYLAGGAVHAATSVGFALFYTLVFKWAFDPGDNVALWGLLFGFVHWILTGANFGVISELHPQVVSGEIRRPGFFAMELPPPSGGALLATHLLFGLIVGWLYTVWAA